MITFEEKLAQHDFQDLKACEIDTLQVNLGKMCNQVCRHCHVDAGPHRKEIMTLETINSLVDILKSYDIGTIDLTGGAPELNPHFEYFVEEISKLGRKTIDRCNLTILTEPGKEHLADFITEHKMEIVASLPYFLGDNVDRQRGKGVFDRSITALEMLNERGYGIEGSGLVLNLVYNPVGAYLPPEQTALEAEYKKRTR